MVTHKAKLLAAIDLMLAGSFGLILPILPLFLVSRFADATLLTVALTYSVYLTAKAIFGWVFELFLAHGDYIKRIKSGLFFGSLIISIVPLAYLEAANMSHILIIQVGLGLGFALLKTSWMHLSHQTVVDFFHEMLLHAYGFLLTFCLAIAAALGGFIAYNYGFTALLYLMSGLGFTATFFSIIFAAAKDKKPAKKKAAKQKKS